MTAEHRRPVCLNPRCGRVLGTEDEGYRTRSERVPVCNDCLTANRPAWMRAEKAARLRALEVAEGLAP